MRVVKRILKSSLMLPFSKYTGVTLILCLISTSLEAQECNLFISGVVNDHETDQGLAYVNIYVQENGTGTTSDSMGHFLLAGLCPGEYHIVLSHIGCDPIQKFIDLRESMEIFVELEHSSKLLEGVVVTGNHTPNSTQNSQTLTEQTIADQTNESLSNLLDNLSGVNTIKNGAGIAKPVIHGLYGNRLTILNNGIAQSGQQWGNDHSPEIDPLVANRISVIKGVSALEYPGSNLGSVILVEPSRIKKEPHLHGSATYAYSSNGRASSGNFQLYRSSKWVDWKLNATLKQSGDLRTPKYYLNNTGSAEGNVALQLQKNFSERLTSNLYFSSFNAELGVLRGSHIGNLTDLKNAFKQEVPFFTEEEFSFKVDAPKQRVNHHLLKAHTKWFISDVQWLDFTFAGQFNNRKEFDVRRSGRTDIPALSLQQFTYFTEVKYNLDLQDQLKFHSGVQFNSINNTNNSETGILPLIPDYLSFEYGIFSVATKRIGPSFLELGLRYDFIHQDVPTITRTTPREIIRYQNFFQNSAAALGWKYTFSDSYATSVNLGFATRNPAINELYSLGLHQGVSGIEEGNINLEREKSLKATMALQATKDFYGIEFLTYYQRIADYIYLRPSEETRLTIRGAFPVFHYDQTNASIYGIDFSGQVTLSDLFKSKVTYSFIRALDLVEQQPLIFIPPSNLSIQLAYSFKDDILLLGRKFENPEVSLSNRYVFSQDQRLAEQDFVAPPPGYNLLSAKASFNVQIGKLSTRFFMNTDNILNINYRDYLNRQRYFADDLGINITIGTRIKF